MAGGGRVGSPKPVSADYYYKIPVRPIYKQYPVYAPAREPEGYIEWLKKQDPVILWDDANHKPKLETEADWIKAGEDVFTAALFTEAGDKGVIAIADVQSTAWYEKGGIPVSKDGVLPFVHYVIREKGKIELGSFSCAMCHTRVMPNGDASKDLREISLLSERSNFPPALRFRRPSSTHSFRPSTPHPGCIQIRWNAS